MNLIKQYKWKRTKIIIWRIQMTQILYKGLFEIDYYLLQLPLTTTQMQNPNTNLNAEHIVQAFQILVNPTSSKEQIKNADMYINACQQNSQFCLILMSIFAQLQTSQTKFQILVHLKTVIKRNWNSKRRAKQVSAFTPNIKSQIKSKLLVLYKMYWKIYYKQFNQIFRELSRYQFPINYEELNGFVKQVLGSLAQFNLQQILESQQLLPYLSLVKVIYKQYSHRRIQHSTQFYHKYIADNVQLSVNIAQKINEILQMIKNQPNSVDSVRLLQCSRKIDKIILYCLGSMVSSLQFNQMIISILKFLLSKVQILLSLRYFSNELTRQAQLNILAIIQGVSKLQQHFPLLMSSFLLQYLQLIVDLLFNQTFTQQKLVNCVICANISTIKTFQYYMTISQFKQSLDFRPGKDQEIISKAQIKCHQVYLNVYSPNNIQTFLQKIVTELMNKYKRSSEQDQIMFEDSEITYEGSNEQGSFQLIITLVKLIIQRFQQVSKAFVQTVIKHILQQNIENDRSQATKNMYQIILLTTKLIEQKQLDMTDIFSLMERCCISHNFDMFCRIVRNYHQQFNEQAILKTFQILISIIINQNCKHITVYQSAVCIRKFLTEYQSYQFTLQKVGLCLTRILQLIQIYKNVPTHLWNLVNLITQILKAFNTQTIMFNLVYLSNCVNQILQMKNNKNMVIGALAQLLQNTITLIDPEDTNFVQNKLYLYKVSIKLVCYPQASEQQQQFAQSSKHLLWLCIVRNINLGFCTQEIKSHLLTLFQQKKEQLISQNPSLFLQILQESLISGLLQISQNDLQSLYQSLIQQSLPDKDIRENIAFFSLYYTQTCLTHNFHPKLLIASMMKLKQLYFRVTPNFNALRTLLVLVISYEIILHGGQKVYGLFNQYYKDYKQWFWVYVWSLQYISNKYSAKVISISILKSIFLLKQPMTQNIDGNIPLDKIINYITLYVEPIKIQQAMNGYLGSVKCYSHSQQIKSRNKIYTSHKSHCRKIKLHVNQALSEMDLSQIYRQKFTQLFKQWDWGEDDLEERYSIPLKQKILKLLNPKPKSK